MPGVIQRTKAAIAAFRGEQPTRRRGYDAARVNNLTWGWATGILAVNDEIHRSLQNLRGRSRELANNNDYVKKYLTLCKTHIVGPQGIDLQVQTPNADLNKSVETAWWHWGKNPDVTGQLTWLSIQRLVIETIARDGEVL
jgi:capsid protein